ncbi:MAG: DUF2147 domain-containing protein [Pseudomonadota bacterium]
MITALISAAAMAAASQTPSPMEAVAGDWVTSDESAIVRLFACADQPEALCGHMIWIEDPAWVEDRFLGGEIISDFRFDGGAWRKGHLTNPEDGNVYRGSIRLEEEGKLKLKGCALRILCKSETWSRLQSLRDLGASPDELVMDRLPSTSRALSVR